MQRMRASKSSTRRPKIDALLAEISVHEMDIAAHVLACVIGGRYFDEDIKQRHLRALELTYLHLGDDCERG